MSHRPELDLALLQRRVDMMNRAFPDARIKVPRDFPRRALAPWGIEVLTPDHLVLRSIPHHADLLITAIFSMASRLNNPARTASDLAENLRKNFPLSLGQLIEYAGEPSSGEI